MLNQSSIDLLMATPCAEYINHIRIDPHSKLAVIALHNGQQLFTKNLTGQETVNDFRLGTLMANIERLAGLRRTQAT